MSSDDEIVEPGAQAAALDSLDVPVGGRVAMVSHNSARLLTSFFGVSSWGRVFVPINFRLSASEIKYIVQHSGAEVVLESKGKGTPDRYFARTDETGSFEIKAFGKNSVKPGTYQVSCGIHPKMKLSVTVK